MDFIVNVSYRNVHRALIRLPSSSLPILSVSYTRTGNSGSQGVFYGKTGRSLALRGSSYEIKSKKKKISGRVGCFANAKSKRQYWGTIHGGWMSLASTTH
ncbi:hypothetical protein CEXT_94221 [Caerostris extrusa]|uniref:Ribosomal protein L2 n=1 Tax=Caerostris extrusa TaxID=172846 RepID=A0AAV4NY60_CAEEX|nr:hypothetical protein CEXT_94221 [Caerostris extrusa]